MIKQYYISIFSLFLCFNSLAQNEVFKTIVSANAPGGYYFLTPVEVNNNVNGNSYNIILDSAGNIVYSRHFFPSSLTRDFKLQPNGLMSFSVSSRYAFLLMDSSFTVIDTISAQNSCIIDCHEFLILPNGHYLLAAEEEALMDLSKYFFFNDCPDSIRNIRISAVVIQELDENKHVVFEWHAKDHFSLDGIDTFFLYKAEVVDWTHFNALEVDYDGNLLMSSRNFNEITKINRKNGAIMWRLGGKYNQFKFIGDTVPFYGQHDIRRLRNGHITLFDNGKNFVSHCARALEYELDETNKTARLVWSYTYDSCMYSDGNGNVQRLQSGATLINWGWVHYIKDNIGFNVVDSNGTDLFKFFLNNKLASFSYRVFSYPTLPWSLHRPQISSYTSRKTLYLDGGKGYSSYSWNNGDTTETIAVGKPGTFFVSVPCGKDGFIYSEKMIVTENEILKKQK